MAGRAGNLWVREKITMSIYRAKGNTPDKTGFTLLEVLIAISIFAVGVLAMATMNVNAIRRNRLGNEVTQATSLAQTQIEALKRADISSTALAPGHYDDPNNPIDGTGAHGGIFTRTWDIAHNTAFSRTVTVSVQWRKGGGRQLLALSTVTRGGGT
jgi:type IV pilus assembly protein PilV